MIGEAYMTKNVNNNIKFVSFNLFIEKCKYFDKNNKIKHIETITEKDMINYNVPIVDKSIVYILDVNNNDKITNIKNQDYIKFRDVINI